MTLQTNLKLNNTNELSYLRPRAPRSGRSHHPSSKPYVRASTPVANPGIGRKKGSVLISLCVLCVISVGRIPSAEMTASNVLSTLRGRGPSVSVNNGARMFLFSLFFTYFAVFPLFKRKVSPGQPSVSHVGCYVS